MTAQASYQPGSTLFLWYLGEPEHPVLVGELHLVLSGRGVSLRYAPSWLAHGFALSEDLPLLSHEFLPRERDLAAGAVDDARPDRWGERVIRLLENPPRLSLLEMLYFAGNNRFGALGVSLAADRYVPRAGSPLPQLADADALHMLVHKVLAGEHIEERYRRLLAPGASMGGARPKALIGLDGQEWVLKFAEENYGDEPVIEHAAMTLAAKAGITVAETRLIPLAKGTAVAVKRFDRDTHQRLHALSAQVALGAAGAELSYPELAQLLRRKGVITGGVCRDQMRELFRRLVFNILIDNTDDHEKNHALLMTDTQHYLLSPAYDVLPTGLALGYQSMGVGKSGAISSVDNALSMASAYGLDAASAKREAIEVACVVDGWMAHFSNAGVPQQTLARLAQQIDGPALLVQRQALGGAFKDYPRRLH